MYLSRIELNTRLAATRRAVSSPQILHAVVENSFPANQKARTLWRVDQLQNQLYLLVQSLGKPDFQHVVEQFGWPSAEQTWETRSYDEFLGKLEAEQKWAFRLRANPTHSVSVGAGNRGKVFAHVTIEQQELWLASRAPRLGAKLLAAQVVQRETKQFTRGSSKGEPKNRVTVGMATYEGILEITDANLLREAMTNGIGRAKAYGCGLLTLARP